MGASVIHLAEVRARRSHSSAQRAIASPSAKLAEPFYFWSGASGQRYVHSVHSLIECPDVPASNYILVHRNHDGQRTVLAVGQATNEAPSLNLAEIRRRGARLGANEVHVHLLAKSAVDRSIIELDILATQAGSVLETLVAATRH